jgi:hypothetical protein
MARAFVEGAGDVLLLSDDSPTGLAGAADVYAALKQGYPEAPEPMLRVTGRWSSWKAAVRSESPNVDFILLVSNLAVFDEDGRHIEDAELMSWMLENSPVPVFALTNQAVSNGAVGGLVGDGEAQGNAAAQLALQIVRGAHPSSLMPVLPPRNLLVINLPAARNWGLRIPIAFPIAARVYRTLPKPVSQPSSGLIVPGGTSWTQNLQGGR